jgi:hypothetical protein
MILVVFLAAAWAVILGPVLLRRRSERGRGSVNSISHFHRQLRILEHAAPEPIVVPAYRLRSVPTDGAPSDGPTTGTVPVGRPVLTVVGADQLPRPALAFLGDALADEPPTRSGTAADDPEARRLVHGVDPVVRQQMCKRRRDTLMVLVSVFVCSAIVGVIPGAQLSLIVTLVSGLALAAYVAMLVHLRSLDEERERTLRYLAAEDDRRRGNRPVDDDIDLVPASRVSAAR